MDEIKAYLWDVLRELPNANADPSIDWDLSDKHGYLQADAFRNWQGTDLHLIGIGMECLTVPDIIAPETADGCRAFIYCHLLADRKVAAKHTSLAQRLSALRPPKGFVPAPPGQDGYLFVKMLGSLPVGSFCSRSDLKSYFQNPLSTLVDWLAVTAPEIASLKKPKSKR